MIRAPSDGSTREKPKELDRQIVDRPLPQASGLPISKADELARLEKSREWLKTYHSVTASNSSITQGEHDGARSLEEKTAGGLPGDSRPHQ